MYSILKYPRTPHLEGSRLQDGDHDCQQVPYAALAGKYIVVEEKMDGANSGVRFSNDFELLLQSRGHYLTGGGREKHFSKLKSWASTHEGMLLDILENRYVMYGEWMHSKHTVFYDRLPHLFLEFDILDVTTGVFLSTEKRQDLIGDAPVVQVPVLYAGIAPKRLKDLLQMIKPSLAKSVSWRETLRGHAERLGLDAERVMAETEGSDLSEGLYIKVEEQGCVVERFKWVRSDFLQTILDNDSHWLARPIVPNLLAPSADIFAEQLTVSWSDCRGE